MMTEGSYTFIIQARSGSTRLPNKILLPFYKSQTILDIQLDNLKASFPSALIILATTTNKADDIIADRYSTDKAIKVFRGDENNVLKRFVDAAHEYKADNIIRICSDNPFLSMQYCKDIIATYGESSLDYVSYNFSNDIPAIRSHTGLFAEAVSLKALEKVISNTNNSLYYEHVTNYIYTNPGKFKLHFITVPMFIDEMIEELRLTIDTQQDFDNMQKLYLAVLNKYRAGYSIEKLIEEVKRDKALIESMKQQIEQYAK